MELVSRDSLLAKEEELRQKVSQADLRLGVDLDSPIYEEALRSYVLHTEWPGLLGDEALDEQRLFYNRYFWFARFVHLHSLVHGRDAGLEQQLFKLLEACTFDLDWELVQRLDERAREEAR